MKARLLTKLLNNTGYRVNNNKDYIAVGSPLCHDLISVNKQTLKVKYALDTFREGRKCFEETSTQSEKTELLFISLPISPNLFEPLSEMFPFLSFSL